MSLIRRGIWRIYLQKKSLGLEMHGLATELYLTPSTLWIDSRLPCSWDFPGKNTGVHCHFLLQAIVPTQGSNQCLLHCRWILCQLSHHGRPMMHGQWQRCKLRTRGRAEARMKHHGNEDTKAVWGENSASARSRVQGPRALWAAVTTGGLFGLHRLWPQALKSVFLPGRVSQIDFYSIHFITEKRC